MRRMLSRIFGSRTHPHRPAWQKRVSLRVEALEQRDLMAVTAATLTNGVLHVVTDSANNNVEIRETPPTPPIILLAGPGAGPFVASDSVITVKDLTRPTDPPHTFNRSEVQRIEVDLGAGNDHLVSDATVRTIVRAGAGNDFVETGSGDDDIFCGEGDDTVHANDGTNTVLGEGGADVLVGGNGKDILNGGDSVSANQLFGRAGDDRLSSLSRNDVVDGGDDRDTLSIVAGTAAVQNGEDVTIAVDGTQRQTDGFSCGPNSGSRFLRAYGFDVSYNSLRRKVKAESILFKMHLGTRPIVLNKVLRGFKSELTLHTGAALQDVLDRLESGNPVIPLVAPSKRNLHYVVLNGFDLDNQTLRFVDTSGVAKTVSFAEFDHQWVWTNQFTGFVGRIERLVLKAAGLKTRTFLG
jgi:hypothetical protein